MSPELRAEILAALEPFVAYYEWANSSAADLARQPKLRDCDWNALMDVAAMVKAET